MLSDSEKDTGMQDDLSSIMPYQSICGGWPRGEKNSSLVENSIVSSNTIQPGNSWKSGIWIAWGCQVAGETKQDSSGIFASVATAPLSRLSIQNNISLLPLFRVSCIIVLALPRHHSSLLSLLHGWFYTVLQRRISRTQTDDRLHEMCVLLFQQVCLLLQGSNPGL